MKKTIKITDPCSERDIRISGEYITEQYGDDRDGNRGVEEGYWVVLSAIYIDTSEDISDEVLDVILDDVEVSFDDERFDK